MPPPRIEPRGAGDWLARAKGHLSYARLPNPPGGFWEDHCFHAQQAAELALKAVYQERALVFRFTHDLDELFKGLEVSGLVVLPSVREAVVLTRFAVAARYPGIAEAVTEEECRRAIALAASVVAWAEGQVHG